VVLIKIRRKGKIWLLVVSNPDIVSGLREWLPGDVEPVGAGQELVGIFAMAEEID